jgi:predicted Zn-dependent peptidase
LQQELGERVLTWAERLKTITNIELKDIREHHRRTHTAENMRFIIVGDLKRRKRKVARMLEGWALKRGEVLEAPMDEYTGTLPVLIKRKDASNMTFGFSFVTKRRLEPAEQYAMGCLNHILNGTMTSKIFGQARKRGLVYGVGSVLGCGAWSSVWDFDGEVNAENANELFDLIAVELARVINGEVKEDDIVAAKNYALGRHMMLAQTTDQIADYYGREYFVVGTYEPMEKAPEMIEGINKRAIVSLAREFMQSGVSGLAAVGNMDKEMVNELWGRVLGSI